MGPPAGTSGCISAASARSQASPGTPPSLAGWRAGRVRTSRTWLPGDRPEAGVSWARFRTGPSPDRLSRKYAYQVPLLEELAHCGVACELAESPPSETPRERLLVQVQGMVAEYERAPIAERSRRGKRHKASNASPSVLSGAPYGYRYAKRNEGVEARYEVLAREADVVRQVFDSYTREQCSMGAIVCSVTERGIPTRTGKRRWDRSMIWEMLRNPAYSGRACCGKTGTRSQQRVTRSLRKPGKFAGQQVGGRERPHEEWIEIPKEGAEKKNAERAQEAASARALCLLRPRQSGRDAADCRKV